MKKKSARDMNQIAPKVTMHCDGCGNDFEKHVSYIRKQLNNEKIKFNNFFCSKKCRLNYIGIHGQANIKVCNLKAYKCTGTGKEIIVPENAKFVSSKFNPDALPFYNYSAVLKWMTNKEKGVDIDNGGS